MAKALLTTKNLSLFANSLLCAYLTLLMFVIGYGLDTGASFGIGRIEPQQGRDLLNKVVEHFDGGDHNNEQLGQRLAMAVLINFRINQAAWWAMLFTSFYSLFFVPYSERAALHLLGGMANLNTLLVHLYHLGYVPFVQKDDLIPRDDPYHKIPLPGDTLCAVMNLAAFLALVRNKKIKDKAE